MKKTLAALAVLSAFAGSAIAADVTLYGRVDLGLRYTHADGDKVNTDATDKFEMSSGNNTGSRFGLKGTEELGNGLKVGFVLENGFDADTGELGGEDTIFNREAIVRVMGNFGELGFGRTSILANDANTYGIGGNFSALGTGWGDVGGQGALWGAGYESRMSNMITYVTPEFAGLKVYAQYSFGKNTYTDDEGDGLTREEGKTTADRYYGIGFTFDVNNLNLTAVVDSTNRSTVHEPGTEQDVKDAVRVIVGGSYDFGMVKPYVAAAYFKDGAIEDVADMVSASAYSGVTNYYYDGYGIMVGANAPVFGGTFHATLGYLDADADRDAAGDLAEKVEMNRWVIGFGYDYNLSKRTVIYADAGYARDSWEQKGQEDADPSMFQAAVGMVHYF